MAHNGDNNGRDLPRMSSRRRRGKVERSGVPRLGEMAQWRASGVSSTRGAAGRSPSAAASSPGSGAFYHFFYFDFWMQKFFIKLFCNFLVLDVKKISSYFFIFFSKLSLLNFFAS